MSCDTEITDEPERSVTISFTAGGQGCWIFVTEGCCEDKQERNFIRLDGDSKEPIAVALAILEFYNPFHERKEL